MRKKTLRYAANELNRELPKRPVHKVIQVPEGTKEPDSTARKLIDGIHETFDGSVLRDTVWPNPPVRGPHGYGRIELKEGAEAKKMHHIFLTGPRREAMINLVREWMRDQKVEDGYGEWVSPAFVVSKKGGRWRGVVDYRALNEATKPENYPLPWIENLLVQFGRKAMFTVLDLKDAFHQVPMHPNSRPYNLLQHADQREAMARGGHGTTERSADISKRDRTMLTANERSLESLCR